MNDIGAPSEGRTDRDPGGRLPSYVAVSIVVHLVIASLLLSATLNRPSSPLALRSLRVQLEASPVKPIEQDVAPCPEKSEQAAKLKAKEPEKLMEKQTPESSKKAKSKPKRKSGRAEEPHKAPKSAEVSTPTLPDVLGFEYPYYLNMLRAKLSAAWLYPTDAAFGKRMLRAKAAFGITRDGGVDHVRLDKSSMNEVFDRSVLRAVGAAAPFPPLPDGYKKEILGTLFITFEYHR